MRPKGINNNLYFKCRKHQLGGLVYNPVNSKYTTQLTPAEEQTFQEGYKTYSLLHGLNTNPDDPEHYYDYRGYGKDGLEPQSLIFNEHLPDTGKKPGHPSYSNESIYKERFVPTIENLADFTGGFETFQATPYVLKTSDGRDQVLAGYGSIKPEIIKLAREGKLTKDIARKEMIRRLQYDYNEGTQLLSEFKNLPEEVKLALVDTSYNSKGVQYVINNSPNLIKLLKSGVTDGKQIASYLTHSKTAGGWLGVRSSARRAMAKGEYNGDGKSLDKFGRQVDHNQYKGPQDYKSSPYYKKYQQGGLIYHPYSLNAEQDETKQEETINDLLSDNLDSSFPVEPVKIDGNIFKGFQQPVQENVKQKGVTQFKHENIDVGNMRELLDRFEEAGISVRVTSGKENRKTKSGKNSKHSVADAIDITPIKGQTYSDLKKQIMNSPELLAYMRENGIGIIDETDPLMKMKTGATGDHGHVSRNEGLALYGFNKLFGNITV